MQFTDALKNGRPKDKTHDDFRDCEDPSVSDIEAREEHQDWLISLLNLSDDIGEQFLD